MELYARFLRVTSREGRLVLDPFVGCVTILVATEKLQRQRVGMGIR
ncbi:MAG: site-specific DNA-methyltransferase [Rhodospirillaceae bacterium]|nr:site-specific DNA-methyltransferase [Rhodospirillaceae bacterium]MYH38103.1 site-specific DNA-methyltransferase [Rhodospirillaceae bacterium]MYK15393.1 site-specific DNA-methyltransferase [Rhodospirillaceae bacterium]